MGSATTNSSGVGTLTYTGTGKGKLRIVAVSDGVESAEYDLYDCKFYDRGTSNSSTWTSTSNITYTGGSDYATLQATNSANTGLMYQTITSSYSVFEFDYNANVNVVFCSLRDGATSITSISSEYLGSPTVDTWHHLRIEVNGTGYRAIIDGVAKDWKTMTGSQTFNRFYFGFTGGNGLILKYKNFMAW